MTNETTAWDPCSSSTSLLGSRGPQFAEVDLNLEDLDLDRTKLRIHRIYPARFKVITSKKLGDHPRKNLWIQSSTRSCI